MRLLFLFIYLLIVCYRLCNKKEIFSITLIYLIIAPNINIGSNDFDAAYFVIIFLIMIILFRREKIKVVKCFSFYLFLFGINFILYFVMTALNNVQFTMEGFSSLLGFLKIPTLIILLSTLYPQDVCKEENYDFAFKILLLINLVGIILQFVFDYKIRGFFEGLYLTDGYRYYSTLPNWLVYNRKFGFFGSPMALGIFTSFSLIFLLTKRNKKRNDSLFLLITLFEGISSLSKTFIIGVPIIYILYGLLRLVFDKIVINTRKIIRFIILLPIIVIVLGVFYNFMAENSTIEYYLKMLTNPMQAFASRYDVSDENILLGETYKIIKENLFFGVGVQKINNEFLGDSTYVLALHHGGIISLITIIIFYAYNCIKFLSSKEIGAIVFTVFWAISGFGFNNFFNVIMTMPFYMYFYGKLKENKEEENLINKS